MSNDYGRHHRRGSSAEEAAAEELRETIRQRRVEVDRRREEPSMTPSTVALGIAVCIAVYLLVTIGGGEATLERWLGAIAAMVIAGVLAWDVKKERR